MKNATRRQIYFWGAIWNLAFALSGLVMPKFTMYLFLGTTEAITGVPARTFFAFFWMFVGVFGLGYYIVSRNPDRNEAVIYTGCLAKVIFFVTVWFLYSSQQVTVFGLLGGLGDLIWTVLFLAARRGEKVKAIA